MSEEQYVIDLQSASIQNHQEVVLNNVDLRLKKGELIYLIGKTLLSL